MKASIIAIAAAAALNLTAAAALAQEAGFGGQGAGSKNQVPGPEVTKPTDPAAGNPGSRAQVPTAPEVQDDLYGNGSTGAAEGDAGEAAQQKPATSDPAPQP
jgi:hypothetical protein